MIKHIIILVILGFPVMKITAMHLTNMHSFNKIMNNPNDHINADTLTLKGRIVKDDMENKKGQKLEGVQDYYFSTTSGSFFIKTVGSKFSKDNLDALVLKEITVKCIKKFGNIDIGPEDPSYAATRVGEYILILEILQ